MFHRSRLFAVICAACAALSLRPALADGEYDEALKNEVINGRTRAGTEARGSPQTRAVAERFADCVMKHAMLGFTADERKLLDAWALGGPVPEVELVERTKQRMQDAALSGMCDRPAGTP